jgi:hypothetical protein
MIQRFKFLDTVLYSKIDLFYQNIVGQPLAPSIHEKIFKLDDFKLTPSFFKRLNLLVFSYNFSRCHNIVIVKVKIDRRKVFLLFCFFKTINLLVS